MEQHGYVNPTFSRYDPVLAAAMTQFLYADRSNPTYDQPNRWPRTGRIAMVNRTLSFTLTGTETETQRFDIMGGKNAIVFSRTASVRPTTAIAAPATDPQPNQLYNYIDCQVQRSDGFLAVEQQPLTNAWGTAQFPYIMPSPEFWYGRMTRNVTLVNTSGVACTVVLGWLCAILDTGA